MIWRERQRLFDLQLAESHPHVLQTLQHQGQEDRQHCHEVDEVHNAVFKVNFNLLMKSKSKCGRNTHLYTQTYRKIRLLEVPLSNISEFSSNNGYDSYRKIRKESKIGVKMAQICLKLSVLLT